MTSNQDGTEGATPRQRYERRLSRRPNSRTDAIIGLRSDMFHSWEIARHLRCSVANVSQVLARFGLASVARHHPTAHTRALATLTGDALAAYLVAAGPEYIANYAADFDALGAFLQHRPQGQHLPPMLPPDRTPRNPSHHSKPVPKRQPSPYAHLGAPSPPSCPMATLLRAPTCTTCAERARGRYRPGIAVAAFGTCANCAEPGAVYPLACWTLAPTIPPLEPAAPAEREEAYGP